MKSLAERKQFLDETVSRFVENIMANGFLISPQPWPTCTRSFSFAMEDSDGKVYSLNDLGCRKFEHILTRNNVSVWVKIYIHADESQKVSYEYVTVDEKDPLLFTSTFFKTFEELYFATLNF
jgi:hypothetical protein